MAASWMVCCVSRGGSEEASADARTPLAALWPRRALLAKGYEDQHLEFFDCLETESEWLAIDGAQPASLLATLQLPTPARAGNGATGGTGLGLADEPTPLNARTDCVTACADAASAVLEYGADSCGELVGELAQAIKVLEQRYSAESRVELVAELRQAAKVLELSRAECTRRVIDLRKDALAGLKWADLSQARRMLKANLGDVKKAVHMFVQALEFRARDRELFVNLRCDVRCDMRIIGRDVQDHSVIFFCTRSQTDPLRFIRDQIILTFEQACKLSQNTEKGEGRVYFVADCTGLNTRLNMDAAAIKDLAAMLGTVFAERIFKILIVDFSRAAQAAWWMVKPFLSPVTREKFAFVGEAKALELCRKDMDGPTFERLERTLKVNRDPKTSSSDREQHARRTTVHDVPLGPPLC